jgi:TPR repeat protein
MLPQRLKRGFNAGDLDAQLALAEMYDAGCGVKRDAEEAQILR